MQSSPTSTHQALLIADWGPTTLYLNDGEVPDEVTQVKLARRGPVIRTDAAKLTTVPGVYAAGDIARVPHNASWAAADGVSLHQAPVFEPLLA